MNVLLYNMPIFDWVSNYLFDVAFGIASLVFSLVF